MRNFNVERCPSRRGEPVGSFILARLVGLSAEQHLDLTLSYPSSRVSRAKNLFARMPKEVTQMAIPFLKMALPFLSRAIDGRRALQPAGSASPAWMQELPLR